MNLAHGMQTQRSINSTVLVPIRNGRVDGIKPLRFGGRPVGLRTALGVAQANGAARRIAAARQIYARRLGVEPA
jgi:hypothetical protein